MTDVKPPYYYYGPQQVQIDQTDVNQINLPTAPVTGPVGQEGANVAAAPPYT